MARFELSISPNYVRHWGVYEAIREIFQNAIDQEVGNSDNIMVYSICSATNTFRISSRDSKLETSSLLFGVTSKDDQDSTIGQFGEGYKLAALVLSRMGYKLTIYNYQSKEVWKPKIIKSRRYNSELLVVDVKKHIFTSPPDADLTFEIEGLTIEDIDNIKSKILFMQEKYKSISTVEAEVLLNIRHKGAIFVSGLYVCTTDEDIKFGYNILPKYIELDRDRSLVDSFKLLWLTSKIWSNFEDKDYVAKLILDKAPDVKHVYYHTSSETLGDSLMNSFQATHGLNSIPVSIDKQYRADIFKAQHPKLKPIYVENEVVNIAAKSSSFTELMSTTFVPEKRLTPVDTLTEFLNKHQDHMNWEMIDDLNEVIKLSTNWRNE